MPYPRQNLDSQPKQTLGRLLFFDPRLSASGQIACASCHDPQLGWADGKRLSIGFARSEGSMNAPSIANSGYERTLFWDGRAASIEEQIPASLRNPIEMNTRVDRATAAIAAIAAYRPYITAAFGDSRVNWARLCDAIATYVRSIQLRDTPYDRFLQGDSAALTDSAIRGLHLFRTRARCMNCHSGALLSDGQYHHLGTSFYGVGNFQGRYAVTHESTDMGRFRTPGLRGVAHTGPWMHNGLINDLDGVLALYNMGWWQNTKPDERIADGAFPKLDPRIRPLNLSQHDLADLKSFLESLSPPPQYQAQPDLPGRVNR
jgi:cytochrome c peroxidase